MNAHHPPDNARSRFSNHVADYVKFRPGYPVEVIELLKRKAGLGTAAKVADLGSGTGIFSKLLLEAGAEVFAVEPNAEMRAAAESMLGGCVSFHSVGASSEATTLGDHSIDLIVAAQAFHWFDRQRARAEFSRILKPNGMIALIWNVRQTESTGFLRDYEKLLVTFAPDYLQVRHENVDAGTLSQFFADGLFEKHTFPSSQSFDFAGLSGRLLSSSYAPASGQPLHEPMMAALRFMFDAHQHDGIVSFLYDTEVYLGR